MIGKLVCLNPISLIPSLLSLSLSLSFSLSHLSSSFPSFTPSLSHSFTPSLSLSLSFSHFVICESNLIQQQPFQTTSASCYKRAPSFQRGSVGGGGVGLIDTDPIQLLHMLLPAALLHNSTFTIFSTKIERIGKKYIFSGAKFFSD